ncbi:cyclin-dependent kinase inhibitor 7-like isoform X2 [Tripterygium wilfordii]|uniref:Cyclin-dependent kinase inhibitor n=1 Tax=Tripterygium wilfordii TaxID=458696 RepID=A0A7J7E312_TRIWF|nr:cyclin-dependent kinase inhibitor 1-like [Tripterygium wilfordii]KAF5752911.1 cyclin-dependent kinase inhibitor 7-like isoform X2 [Tripterygium wilfordii]
MVRKCRGITEISVMEVAQVGVRTRARALDMADASSASRKRRKVSNGEIQISTTSYFQLGSSSTTSGGFVVKPENSATSAPEQNSGRPAVEDVRCLSPSSDHASISCCSSNGSSERFKDVDPEDERAEVETSSNSCAERETTPTSELPEESGDLDSTAKPYKANSRPRSSVEKMMPPELELEEFFAEAEKKLKQEFTEKYNFDVEKGEPLVGRYEWVRVDE